MHPSFPRVSGVSTGLRGARFALSVRTVLVSKVSLVIQRESGRTHGCVVSSTEIDGKKCLPMRPKCLPMR